MTHGEEMITSLIHRNKMSQVEEMIATLIHRDEMTSSLLLIHRDEMSQIEKKIAILIHRDEMIPATHPPPAGGKSCRNYNKIQ